MQNVLNLIPLSYYAFTGLLNFLNALILSILLVVKNYRSKVNRACSLFTLSVALWSLFYFMWLITPNDKELAEWYLRTCMIFVLFMPALFFHFVVHFVKYTVKGKYIIFNYFLAVLFSFTIYTPLYAHGSGAVFSIPYWLYPGPIFHLAIFHFGVLVMFSSWLLYKSFKESRGIFRNQVLYMFIGTLIGFIGGSTNYFSWYRIPFPPILNFLVSLYVGIIAYAILKHRLMNIDVVIKKGVADILLFFAIGIISLFVLFGIEKYSHSAAFKNSVIILLIVLFSHLFRKLKRAMGKEVTSHKSHVTSYVQVEITDTGCGIKPGDLGKLFNPLHSTKSMHIGLSLAIAHRLVEAHGGYMDVKSKVGEGGI